MNSSLENLRAAVVERLANCPPEKRSQTLVEVDPADIVAGLATPSDDEAVDKVRAALVAGSVKANGRPVAVRGDQLAIAVGLDD